MDNETYIKILENAVIKLLDEADGWCDDSRGHEAPYLEVERELVEAIKRKNSVAAN